MMRIWFCMALLACSWGRVSLAQSDSEPQVKDSVAVNGDRLTTVDVPARDGKLAWADVMRALVRTANFDETALQGMLPSGSLDLNSAAAGFIFLGVNTGTDGVLKMERINDQGVSKLRITCNRTQLRKKHANWMRPGSEASESDYRACEFKVDPVSDQAKTNALVTICIHGYNADPTACDLMRDAVRKAGIATGSFCYDYRQTIEESAGQLSKEIRKLAETRPGCRVALVGHSMGGLVARTLVELPELDCPCVVQLITLASPHGGSAWAHAPPVLSAQTKDGFDMDTIALALLGADQDQGFRDLVPNSDFLRKLNARPMNRRVRYTCIVGTGGPLTTDEAAALRDSWKTYRNSTQVVQLLTPRLDPILNDLSEVTVDQGDGAVAVSRAVREGVTDVENFPLSHTEILLAMESSEGNPVWNAVIRRLKDSKLPAAPK